MSRSKLAIRQNMRTSMLSAISLISLDIQTFNSPPVDARELEYGIFHGGPRKAWLWISCRKTIMEPIYCLLATRIWDFTAEPLRGEHIARTGLRVASFHRTIL
jgi:hypothetical protein